MNFIRCGLDFCVATSPQRISNDCHVLFEVYHSEKRCRWCHRRVDQVGILEAHPCRQTARVTSSKWHPRNVVEMWMTDPDVTDEVGKICESLFTRQIPQVGNGDIPDEQILRSHMLIFFLEIDISDVRDQIEPGLTLLDDFCRRIDVQPEQAWHWIPFHSLLQFVPPSARLGLLLLLLPIARTLVLLLCSIGR